MKNLNSAAPAPGTVDTSADKKALYDLCIRNARVMDPESGVDEICSIGVLNGRIDAVTTEDIRGKAVLDAKGCIAAPGFLMQCDAREQGCTYTAPGDARAAKDALYLLELARRTGGAAWMRTLARLSLEPARRAGLETKGRLRQGCDADIVIFEPDRVATGRRPKGVRHVIRAGKIVYGFLPLPNVKEFMPSDKPRVRRQRSRFLRLLAG